MRRSRHSPRTYAYAAHDQPAKKIKFGISILPLDRVRIFGKSVSLLADMPSDRRRERLIHSQLQAHRAGLHRGSTREWYWMTQEVMLVVAELPFVCQSLALKESRQAARIKRLASMQERMGRRKPATKQLKGASK